MLPVRLNQKTIKKYVMIRKKREKVLGEQKKKNETVKYISECVYKDCSRESEFVLMNYFPYFCL